MYQRPMRLHDHVFSPCYLCCGVTGKRRALQSSSGRNVRNANWLPPPPKDLLFRILEHGDSFGHWKSGCDYAHATQLSDAYCLFITLGGTGSHNFEVVGVDNHYWFYHSDPKVPGQQEATIALNHDATPALLTC